MAKAKLKPVTSPAAVPNPSPTSPSDRIRRLASDASDMSSAIQHQFGAYTALETMLECGAHPNAPLDLRTKDLFALVCALNEPMRAQIDQLYQFTHQLYELLAQAPASLSPADRIFGHKA